MHMNTTNIINLIYNFKTRRDNNDTASFTMAAGYTVRSIGPKGRGGPFLFWQNWGECMRGREGVKLSHLGVSKYRTIWLKTAVFPIWPRAKMGDFGPRKRAIFDPIFDPPKLRKKRIEGSP